MRKILQFNLLVMMAMLFVASFNSCSKDEEKEEQQKEKTSEDVVTKQKNEDLKGWWVEPEIYGGSSSPNLHSWALHFVGDNVIESFCAVIKKTSYGGGYSTEDVGDYAFTYNSQEFFYSKQNSVYTYAYEREGNTIHVQRSKDYDNVLVIVDGKIKWGSQEYVKVP